MTFFCGVDPPRAAAVWDLHDGPVWFREVPSGTSAEMARNLARALVAEFRGEQFLISTVEKPFPRVTEKPTVNIHEAILRSGYLIRAVESYTESQNIQEPTAISWRARLGINRLRTSDCKALAMRLSDKARTELGSVRRRGPCGGSMEHSAEADMMAMYSIMIAHDRGLIETTGCLAAWLKSGVFRRAKRT